MMETNGLTIHVDTPSERTARKHFSVNGWIAGDEVVEAIWIPGRQSRSLSFCERPDVVRVFPSRHFVRGFSGKGQRQDFGENGLRLALRIKGEVIEVEHPLPAGPPALSPGRRLTAGARLIWLAWRARLARASSWRWELTLEGHLLQRELRSKIFRREHTDALLADFARALPDAVFMQIGANDGLTGDPLRELLTGPGSKWRGVMVEPVAHLFAQLRERYPSRPGLRFERAAIGEQDGIITLYRIQTKPGDPLWLEQLASLDREVLRRNAEGFGVAEDRIVSEEVACLNARTLLQRHDIRALDLLIIDTEGWDWRVLRQFNLARLQPKLIVYEHQHLSSSESNEAHEFLAKHGYEWAETPEGDTIAWR